MNIFQKKFKINHELFYAFVKKYPSIINKLSQKQRKQILDKYPNLVEYLNRSLLISSLKENPKLIEFVKKYRREVINDINIQNIFKCIKFLNIDEQKLIINKFINNPEMYKYFNQNLIIDLLSNTNKQIDISECDEELQFKIVNKNRFYISKCSNNVLKKYLISNPSLVYNLDYDLLYNNIDIIKNLINDKLIDRKKLFINLFSKYRMEDLTQEFLINEDFEEFKLSLLRIPHESFNISNRKKLFAINPRVDKYWLNDDIDIVKEYIYDRLKIFDFNNHINIDEENIDSILLVLSNDTIMEKIDKEFMQEFFNNPSYDNLIKIVFKVYGSQCANILKNRPKLNAKLIPTLDIFNPKIIKTFGYKNIQNFLSYDNDGYLVLKSLIQNDEVLNKYIQFRNITKDYYNNTFIDLEKQLFAFYEMKEFLLSIDVDSLNEKQRYNLIHFINDRYANNDDKFIMYLDNINQLDNYLKLKNEMYDMQFREADNIQKIKKILYSKYFGFKDEENLIYEKGLSNLSLIKFYNIELLIGSEKIYQFFDKNEIMCLKLLLVIYKTKDIDFLKEIYLSLKNNEFIINPLYFKKIIDKIPNIYAQNIIDGLFKTESVKESSNEIIIKDLNYNNNKIKCFILNGEKFDMLVHYKTFGFANFRHLKDKRIIDKEKIYESFMNCEEGMSTISCSLISDESWFCTYPKGVDGGVMFGFSDLEKEDIIAMGPRDISLSHDERSMNPISNSEFNFPLNLERIVANTYSIHNNQAIRNNNIHDSYNEVGLSRRHQNIDKIRNDDITGGRILPTYIVVYDNVDEISLKLALEFKIPIVVINTSSYKLQNNYSILGNKRIKEELTTEIQEELKIYKK